MALTFGYRLPFTAASVNSIALDQTLGAAGALTINGALAMSISPNDGGTVSFFANPQTSDGPSAGAWNVPVSLTSTGNLSGIDFTITGTVKSPGNPFQVVTETIAGPNNNTVNTTALFNRVLSITADDAVATAVSAGHIATGASTFWLPIMGPGNSMPISGIVDVTNTINYTLQQTGDDPFSSTAPAAQNSSDTNVVASTSSQSTNWFAPPAAVRCVINSGSGSLVFKVIQNGLTS